MRALRLLREEVADWASALLAMVPGRIGRLVRRWCYAPLLGACGERLSVGRNVEICCLGNIYLGSDVALVDGCAVRACDRARIRIEGPFAANANARLVADVGGEILIGRDVMVGPNAVLRASNHVTDRVDVTIWSQGQTGGRIVIGDDVWMGANVVVVPGVTIGSHVVVAAGAVVTRDVPDYAVVAGVPARVIADRRLAPSESLDTRP